MNRSRVTELEAEVARLERAVDETHLALNMAIEDGIAIAEERDQLRAQLARRRAAWRPGLSIAVPLFEPSASSQPASV